MNKIISTQITQIFRIFADYYCYIRVNQSNQCHLRANKINNVTKKQK